MRVLIVGGGLAGLSAAVALGQRGHKVVVAELTGRVDGAVIAITNRAVDALESLGVLEEARPFGFLVEGTQSLLNQVFDMHGNVLPVPQPPPRADTRLPASISLLRPHLARILTAVAETLGAEIRVGADLRTLDDEGNAVSATFADGSSERFDLVVGADGIQSRVRSLILPDAPQPEYTGHMSFRWLLADAPPGQAGLYALPTNDMLITTRLPGNIMYLSTGLDMERRHVLPAEARQLLRDVLGRYPAPFIQALLDRLDERQDVLMRPYDWLKVPTPWHKGRVVLIGDAVHATTAHLASGGSLAIEDAVVLAEELEAERDIEAALTAFTQRRWARSAMVVDASVALLKLQQQHASPAESARLRSEAVAALRQPY